MNIPITKNFDQGEVLGQAKFDKKSLKQINDFLSTGQPLELAVGFTQEKDDDGNTTNAELMELSLIMRPPQVS